VTSMSGGLGYMCGVFGAAPHGMVLRLLCMMIDALRCAGVAYLPGMMNFRASSETMVLRSLSVRLHGATNGVSK
jgi:hypothetical protein